MLMIFLWVWTVLSAISADISIDRTNLTLRGENEELTQEQFRYFGNIDILVSVTLEGFNVLRNGALSDCKKMVTLNFKGESLKSIESFCFLNCIGLTSIEFPNCVETINLQCINYCSRIQSITFPRTAKSLEGFYFIGYDGLKKIFVKEGNPYLSTDPEGTILIMNKTIALFCVNKDTIKIPAEIIELQEYFINSLKLIKHVVFEEGSNLTHVKRFAFRWINVKELIFPPKLKFFGEMPFEYSSIESLYLPASLETVPNNLFVGLPLTNLTIEPGIKALNVDPEGAVFSKDNSTLMFIKKGSTALNIRNATHEIPTGIIHDCKTIINITVEPGHPKFYDWNNILYNKEGLKEAPVSIEHAILDGKCTKILNSAFGGCTKLQSIDFNGSKITSFGSSAFFNCKSLNELEIPSTLESLESYCFNYASLNGVKLKFGPSFKSISIYAFVLCGIIEIDFSECQNSFSIQNYCFNALKSLTKLILPPKCTSIEKFGMVDCSSLKSITIPETVNSIAEFAFSGCSSLEELIFEGNGLESIQKSAFENCNLSEVTFPDSLTELQTSAFKGNKNMRIANFTENSRLEMLSFNVFEGCSRISEIFLGDSAVVLTGAFYNMMNLTNISVSEGNPNYKSIDGVLYSKDGRKLICCPGGIVSLDVSKNVNSFERSAFLGCSKLISIEMDVEQNITIIPEQTFYGCSSLLNITIPRAVEKIESGAFQGCKSLKDIIFTKGSKVEILGSSSFSGCEMLESVIFEDGSSLTNIQDGAFEGCGRLSFFTFGESITSIGSKAFCGCPLSSIIFRSNITSIGDRCFEGSMAGEVLLPASVESLGAMCFTGCTNLRRIVYCGETDLSNVLVMTSKEIEQKKTKFYTRSTYSYSKAGGFTPIRVLDENCRIPTIEFTNHEVDISQTLAFVVNSVLCGNTENDRNAEGEERSMLLA